MDGSPTIVRVTSTSAEPMDQDLWLAERAIRAVLEERARAASSGDSMVREAHITTNVDVAVHADGSAEVSSYEIRFTQEGGGPVLAREVIRRVDHLVKRSERWEMVASRAEPILGGELGARSPQRPDPVDVAPVERSEWRDSRDLERLNVAYARHIDDGDYDGFASLFARGTWNGLTGKRATLDWLAANIPLHADGRPGTLHAISNLTIEIDGDTATGISTLTVYRALRGRIEPHIINDYHDRYARDDAGWYFVERSIVRRMRAG
jgi:hypothetical protein